jgi:ABC-type sugar transport system permease subunit
MSTVLALSRPTEWNFPLFVHVLGAMILVGGLLTAISTLVFARGNDRFLRLGYWTLLAVAVPGWIVMFAGANWINSKEGWDDLPEEAQPTWIGIGWTTALFGGLLLLISLIVGGIGMARLRNDRGTGLLKATMVISIVVLAAYVVTVWAMAGKPD